MTSWPIAAGTSPISEIPSPLRSISTENRGGGMSCAGVTCIRSRTRAESTEELTIASTLNRAASVGAVPVRLICNPSVATRAQS